MTGKTQTIVKEYLGSPGSMVSASKGQYSFDNPNNLVIFNSNLCNAAGEKLWYGDLDLTLNYVKLGILAKELNTTLHVLREMDGRFENEENPRLESAVYSTDGTTATVKHTDYYGIEEGTTKPFVKTLPEPTEEEIEARNKKLAENYSKEDYEEVLLLSEQEMEEIKEEESLGLGCISFYNCVDFALFSEGLSKDISPIHKFQYWLRDTLGLTDEELGDVYTKYYISAEDYEFFKKQYEYWVRTFHGRYTTEYRIQQEVSTGCAFNGPSHFAVPLDWVELGKIYFKKVDFK